MNKKAFISFLDAYNALVTEHEKISSLISETEEVLKEFDPEDLIQECDDGCKE